MKFLKNFYSKKDNSLGFSDFFLHASEKKKEEVLRQAAQKANEDQIEIFKRARIKTKTR